MTEHTEQDTLQELTVEESFAELDQLIRQMENDSPSLEESFRLYARGMQLLKNCSEKIDVVEKKMLRISEDGTLVEF